MGVHHMTAYLRRAILALLLIAVSGSGFVSPSYGAEESVPEEWIFSVTMPPKWTITDAIIAYQYKGAYYLPIVSLGDAFEFFIEAEIDRSYISGFAGREENSFIIDGGQDEYIVKGELGKLPVDAIIPPEEVYDEDIYVRMDILNEIWPVEMQLQLSVLTISVEAEEELAFEKRAKREDRRDILLAQQQTSNKDFLNNLPYVENKRRMFGKPVLDLQATYTYDDDANTLKGANNIAGIQQIGKFEASYGGTYNFVDGKFRRPSSFRLRFERQAVGDEYLLIPSVKHFEFGDVNLGQRDLIGTNTGGRGFIISDKDATRLSEFDRVTVEGTGPPGWEIELYNNSRLIEFGAVEPDGEYRFENIVLNYGNNRIRIIMFGPQGQVREEVQEYTIGGSMLSPGEFDYTIGAIDTGRPFLLLENEPRTEPRGITQKGEFAYGLNNTFTVFGSYSKTPERDEDKQYATLGTSFSTPIGLGSVEGYKEINGGKAVDTRFITQVAGVSLNLRSALFDKEFESQESGFGDNGKRWESEIQANTLVDLFIPLDLRVNLLHLESHDGNVRTTLGNDISYRNGGFRVSNSTNSIFVNQIHTQTTGTVNTTWRAGDWQVRGNLGYTAHPEWDLSSGNTEIRYKTKEGFQSALGFSHNFANSVSTIGGQLGYDFENVLASVDTEYQKDRGWQFMLRASSSLHPYTEDGAYTMYSQSQRNAAKAKANIFLDRNNDGIMNGDDTPIENVRILVDNGRSKEETNKDGLLVTTVPTNRDIALRIDETSLLDPYLKPGVEGYRTTGRRGSMPEFDFPIVETGAIDGTVYRSSNDAPVQGMRLQLVNSKGTIAMQTETAFDGYYAFEFVVPDTYTVRADPEYKVNVLAETVTVSSEEPYQFGVDLLLIEPAAEKRAVVETDGESVGIAQTDPAPAASGTKQQAQTSSDGDNIPVVEAVRIGEHPDKIRFVLDLSVMADYMLEESAEGYIIMLDLPNSRFEAAARATYPYNQILQGYETENLPQGGTRIILRARDRMTVIDAFKIDKKGGQPPRIVIDLARK